ncbi:MAG: hypothetical protein ACPG5B_07815 [Chitinophagales bacterium]
MIKHLLLFFSMLLATTHVTFGQCESLFNKSCPYNVSDTTFQQVIEADAYCCYAFWDTTCQSSYDSLQLNRHQKRSATVKNDTLCERSLWQKSSDALCQFFLVQVFWL